MISLVLTSLDRKSELVRIVTSLNKQVDINFAELQLIFIDQGENRSCFESLNNYN